MDPLAEKYPGWSPYNYTLLNPVKLVDPDGQEPQDIIDKNGNKLDISITNNQLVYGNNVSKDVQNTLNGMWKTKAGQGQVSHLLKTKSKVYIQVSNNVGAIFNKGKYYGVYGLTGPTENQSKKMIKDYDGGKVYKENTLTLYKGTYEYGKGDKTALNSGNISIFDESGNNITKNHRGQVNLEPSQNPDKLYENLIQFYNLGGTHETEHTKSSNIKLQRRGQDAETPAYNIENKSRKQLQNN